MTIEETTDVTRRARRAAGGVGIQGALRASAAALLVVFAASAVHAAGGEPKSEAELRKEAIFQGVNLLLLLGVIYWAARKPITEYFKSRREAIKSDLDRSAELLTEAEQRNAELQRKLVDLNAEVDEIKELASQRASTEAENILADARATAERIRRDAKAAADQELRRARIALREEAADLALELAAGKLRSEVGESDRERLLDEFITRVEPGAGTEGANR